jgi:hypothetical protein
MKIGIKVIAFLFLFIATACTHYSTAVRNEAENSINAPISIVWEKTLEILPSERITLKTVDKDSYFVAGKKHATFWSWGDDISIRLVPKGEQQTIMLFDAGAGFQLVGWGHQERMVKDIFQRIKTTSENFVRQ